MADPINFKKAYEQIPARVRGNTSLRDALGLFVDHWGMDYYDPPEAAISAVRQIVQAVIGVADASNLQNPQETPASSEPVNRFKGQTP